MVRGTHPTHIYLLIKVRGTHPTLADSLRFCLDGFSRCMIHHNNDWHYV